MALAFSVEAAKRIGEVRSRYPNAQAACLPVLHIAQEEFGYLSDEAQALVASTLELPLAHIWGVVSFYTMFHREPVGDNVVLVCTNVSCMLRGGTRVLQHLEEQLGIKAGQTTADKRFTLIEEECLAACADAPMAVCGKRYFLRLDDNAKVDQMVVELRSSPERGH